MSNFLDSTYQDLNGLTNISADEVRTNTLYINGILIDPNLTNFNDINCETLVCQGDLSANKLYATTTIQGVPVSKYAYLLNVSNDIQSQFSNITSNYVLGSFLTDNYSDNTYLANNYVLITELNATLNNYVLNTALNNYVLNSFLISNYRNNTYLINNLPSLSTNNTYSGNNTFPNGTSTYIHDLNCRNVYGFGYIDFRSCLPSYFFINNDMISQSAIIGLTTSLNSKVSQSSLTSQLSNYVLTSALNTILSTYMTTAFFTSVISNYLLTSTFDDIIANYATNAYVVTTINTKLLDYVTNSNFITTLSNYVTDASLNSILTNYITQTSLTTQLASYVTQTSLTTQLASYVTQTSLTTQLASYVLSSFLTSNYRNNAYLTANIPTLAGANTYGGNNTFPDGTSTYIHDLNCRNLYGFGYIDFRNCLPAYLFINNNMIAKSVIIGLTSDLSTINTNISNLQTQTTANTAAIVVNTAGITALVALTTTHSGQIAANTAAIGVLQGQVTVLDGQVSTLQAKTSLQNVVGPYLQLTGGLKIMSGVGVSYNIIMNNDGTSTFYNKMIIDDELQVNSGLVCAGIQTGSANITNGDFTVANVGQSVINNNLTLNNSVIISSLGSTTVNNPISVFNNLKLYRKVIREGVEIIINTISLLGDGSSSFVGKMIVKDDLQIDYNMLCSGTSTFNGKMIVDDQLEVTAGITCAGIETETLDVSGNVNISASGATIINNDITLNKNVTISSEGITTINNDVFINNNYLTITNGGLSVALSTYPSKFLNPSIFSGAIRVNNDTTFYNSSTSYTPTIQLYKDGHTIFSNKMIINNEMEVLNGITCAGIETETLDVSGNVNISASGATIINNDLILNKNVTISSLGTTTVNNPISVFNNLNIYRTVIRNGIEVNLNTISLSKEGISEFDGKMTLNNDLQVMYGINCATLQTNNLTITNGSISISGPNANVFNNKSIFNNEIQTNNLQFIDTSVVPYLSIGTNYPSINNISIGNSLSVISLNGLTVFSGPSFNMSSYINQVL